MSNIPGLAQVLGIGAVALYRFLDPRAKRERLNEARKRIIQEPSTPARAHKLALLDDELQRVSKEIERRCS